MDLTPETLSNEIISMQKSMQTDHTQLLDTHLKIINDALINAKEYDYTKDVVDLDALAITDEAKTYLRKNPQIFIFEEVSQMIINLLENFEPLEYVMMLIYVAGVRNTPLLRSLINLSNNAPRATKKHMPFLIHKIVDLLNHDFSDLPSLEQEVQTHLEKLNLADNLNFLQLLTFKFNLRIEAITKLCEQYEVGYLKARVLEQWLESLIFGAEVSYYFKQDPKQLYLKKHSLPNNWQGDIEYAIFCTYELFK